MVNAMAMLVSGATRGARPNGDDENEGGVIICRIEGSPDGEDEAGATNIRDEEGEVGMRGDNAESCMQLTELPGIRTTNR